MMNKKKYNKKFGDVMREFSAGKLQSGKPGYGKGKKVKSSKQAKAIAASEARKKALGRMSGM